jgi:hypothetical protein
MPVIAYSYGNAAKDYYEGNMSKDEYLDSLGCPPKYEPPVIVEHSDGTWSSYGG